MFRAKATAPLALLAVLSLAACSATPSTGESASQENPFPDSPITLIVPFPAGSGPDASARVIALELESDLGVSVIVENIAGGSSTIGQFELASAAPDGYTIGYVAATGISVQSRLIDTPFQGLESLTPIAETSTTANVMFTSPNSGIETIADFVKAAKASPGKLTVGLGNRASGQDIQLALLEKAAGIDVKPVYFDAGQMVLPAVNGTVDVSVAQFGPVVQYVDKGDLIYVGAFDAPDSLDVALFADEGYDTDRWNGWEGVFGPAGMDPAVVAILSDAVGRAVESKSYQDYVTKTFGIPSFVGWDEFADVAAQTDADSIALIADMGLKK